MLNYESDESQEIGAGQPQLPIQSEESDYEDEAEREAICDEEDVVGESNKKKNQFKQKYKKYIYESLEDKIDQRCRQVQRIKYAAPSLYHNNYYLSNDELPPERSTLKFPPCKEIFEYVQDKQRLIELINIELKRNNLIIDIKIYQTLPRFLKTMFAVCISCGYKLLMKFDINKYQDDSKFRLTYFDNTHLHENQSTVILSKDFRHKLFMKEFQSFDKKTSVSDFFQHLNQKFNVTEKDFRYFFVNFQEKRDQEMRTLMKFLKQNGAKVWMCAQFDPNSFSTLPEINDDSIYPKDPDYFLYSLDYMYQNCTLFGRICSISIIPGYVYNKDKNGEKRWEIITFSGLNHFNQLVPYAFAFLNVKLHTIRIITAIIHKFFQDFNISPEIIYTPYSQFNCKLITSVKQTIKSNILHLYDGICYIETIGDMLDNINHRIFYQNIILSRTKGQFRQNCRILQKKVEPTAKNIEAYNKLTQIAPKMCFGLIDTHLFIGLNFRHSANKYVLNLLRQIFTRGIVRQIQSKLPQQQLKGGLIRRKWRNADPTIIKSVFLISRAAIKYNKEINSEAALRGKYCQWRSEYYLELPEIENIRMNIKREFLDLIMWEYGKIFEMEADQRELKDPSLPEMKTFDVKDRNQKASFVVSAYPIYNSNHQFTKFIWRCNCCYSLKSGLPCAHEIKVAIITDTSIFDLVHQLWLKQRVFGKNLKRRGRCKGTRRNTEK